MELKMMPTLLLLLSLFLGSRVLGEEHEDGNIVSTELDIDILNEAVTGIPTAASSPRSDEEIAQRWRANYAKVKNFAKSLVKGAVPFLMSSTSNFDIVSPSCRKAGLRFLLALQKLEPWALYMLDASAKGMSGILSGTLMSFGSYEQCLDVVATERRRNTTKELFKGQYCTVRARPILPKKPRLYTLGKRIEAFKMFENDTGVMRDVTEHAQLFYVMHFRLGICVPSSCSAEDIHGIVSLISRKTFDYEILKPDCETKQPNRIEAFQIPVLVIFSFLVALVLCGTCAEMTLLLFLKHRRKKTVQEDSTGMKFILAFSAYRNFMTLLDTDSASEKLKVLHGIRVYSITWIVLGHTFYYINFSMIKHLRTTVEIAKTVEFSVVTNAPLLVDNFFFISGCLMIYVTMNILERTGKQLNIFHFIIHRIWRFLPIQMAFVGIVMLLPWMGSGPLWHETIDPLVDGCRKDWWANLLFINNIYRSSTKGCVSHSWYLAADLQLYIFSLVVLIPLLRKPRVGLLINLFLIAAHMLYAGLSIYLKDSPPTALFVNPDPEHRARLIMEILYAPHQHLGSFCIGIFLGYIMKCYQPPKRIHPAIQVLAWTASIAVSSAVLFGIHEWSVGNNPGKFAAAMYAALCRVSWTLTVAWITFACSSGYGGVLNRLLCWKPLIPLSRLTFLMYMTHPFIQQLFYANLSEGFQAKNYPAVFFFFSVVFSGYGLAAILCLFLESPFMNLGRMIFHRTHNKERISSTNPPQWEQVPDKLSRGALDSVSFERPLTNLSHHFSEAVLVDSESEKNAFARKAFENDDVVYHL